MSKTEFIWLKYRKNCNTVKYYNKFKSLFSILIYFIPVMQSWISSDHYCGLSLKIFQKSF